MFTLFLRAMFLYIMMILVMRVLGKRQLGEFQPYEFALTILLADIISGPIGSVSTPLLHGLLPVAAVMVVHGVLSIACMKSDKFRAVVSGKPTLVISQGKIDQKELDRLCLSLSDLLEGLRNAGFQDPAEVGTAVVEANGSISAFSDSASRPPKVREMNLDPGYEGLPLPLIMDGRLQRHNLHQTGRTEAWLSRLLAARGTCIPAVYLASLDTQGRMFLQLKDGALVRFAALDPKEVNW
ncbi:MAG: DUF421 domain-containing protein [Clostridia bacterium]|nr:DUF421 domain-containing protein [Clostridia bacterium]